MNLMQPDLPRRFIVRIATEKEVDEYYLEAMLERMARDSDRNGYPMGFEIQRVEDAQTPALEQDE
ncbi:MAG: hypothetical protein ACE5KU_05540 [Nitrososphaerales archaeon]